MRIHSLQVFSSQPHKKVAMAAEITLKWVFMMMLPRPGAIVSDVEILHRPSLSRIWGRKQIEIVALVHSIKTLNLGKEDGVKEQKRY